ncbi:related to tol protein [Cephalotrichum gorgonifer]|uniref:Related to tol protein n=1 Tax=Cephalotrichum gorgonifer TaxID=2041049 RepID=A0AAE8N189_9PEZI|nr:related to tol protein [Cephalotrichum gorgonifer]
MGGSKIRDYIKRKVGLQPTTPRCPICFNFVEDDSNNTNLIYTLEHVHLSAGAGCFTCGILRDVVEGTYGAGVVPVTQLLRLDLNVVSSLILLDEDRSTLSPRIEFYNPDGDTDLPWEALDRWGNTIAQTTKSASTHNWVKFMLKECIEDHPTCANYSDMPLPTRVIDVNYQVDRVRVIETKGQQGKYVTLSHCWGDQKLMNTKLTPETFDEYTTDGIPIDTFPKTFQDAIEYTRKLELPYLWIDSMCIIQGDAEDWARESVTMASVYSNTYITLAGISAKNCQVGLHCGGLRSTELSGETPDGKSYTLFAREPIEHYMKKYPLLSRAWCFQETVLSPRTLYFGDKEMLWLCRERRNCECNLLNDRNQYHDGQDVVHDAPFFKLPPRSVKPKEDKKSFFKLPSRSFENLGLTHQPFDPVTKWYELVNGYGTTFLSFETDRLIAVQGLVDYMSHWRPDEQYYGGVWSGSVARDLLWTSKSYGDTSHGLKRTRTMIGPDTKKTGWSSDKWLFPTWSWASVTSETGATLVEYQVLTGDERSYPDNVFLTHAVDKVLGEDGNGGPPAGKKPRYELRVKRPVFAVSHEALLKACEDEEPDHPEGYYNSVDFSCDYGGFKSGDWKEYTGPEPRFYILRMMKCKGHFAALILVCVDEEKQVYERFGLIDWNRSWDGTKSGTVGALVFDKRWRPGWWEPEEGVVVEDKVITLV